MSLVTLAIIMTVIGAGVTGMLAILFARDPETGLRQSTHRLEFLPMVMADRYVAMTALALGAAWLGDMRVIAFLFTAFAWMGFADGWIYYRAGHPHMKHTLSGIASAAVVLVALLAGGAA